VQIIARWCWDEKPPESATNKKSNWAFEGGRSRRNRHKAKKKYQRTQILSIKSNKVIKTYKSTHICEQYFSCKHFQDPTYQPNPSSKEHAVWQKNSHRASSSRCAENNTLPSYADTRLTKSSDACTSFKLTAIRPIAQISVLWRRILLIDAPVVGLRLRGSDGGGVGSEENERKKIDGR